MLVAKYQRSVSAAHELRDRRQRREHFYPFLLRTFETVSPGAPFVPNWHIEYICELLEAAYYKLGPRKLIINIPPRNLKSIICTVAFPAWILGKDASEQIMAASYSAKLAVKHSLDCRLVIESEWYKRTFPETLIAPDQNEKGKYQTTKRGHRIATSVGGTATGEGGNVLILDDPMNPKEAMSDTERESVNTWIEQTWSSRMNTPDGIDLVIMQRLHEDDPTGKLLADNLGYEHIMIPMEAERRTIITLPLSGKEVEREPGDLLHEERFDHDFIARQKRRLGTYGYSGQYQQNPVPLGGGMFKEGWWRFYDRLPEVPDEIIQSWDMTFKETKDGSFVVGQVWLRKGADKYLVDQVRDLMDFPETIRQFICLTERYPEASRKLVEDKANGPAVIDTLKHRISGIVPIKPDGSKEARAAAYAAQVEAGNIYLPNPEVFPEKRAMVEGFIEEHSRCPKGKHWDQIDAASQAVRNMVSVDMSDMYNEDDIIMGPIPAAMSGDSPWA